MQPCQYPRAWFLAYSGAEAKRIGANVTDATAMPFDHQLSSTMDGDGSLSFYCQWPFHET